VREQSSFVPEKGTATEQLLSAVDVRKLFDVIKAVLSVISLLAGIGFLFVLAGWIIVSSHVREIGLYGIADWTQRFIVDANIAFVRDWYEFLFAPPSKMPFTHVLLVIASFPACTWFAAFSSNAWIKSAVHDARLHRVLDRLRRYGYNLLMLGGIIVGNFAIFFSANKEYTTRVYIFVFIFSLISGALLHLGFLLRKTAGNPRSMKQIALLSFLTLFMVLQVPFIYGKFLYRINVYEINSFSPGITDVIKDPKLAGILADTAYERFLLADYSDICTFLLKTKNRFNRQYYFIPIKKELIESYLIRLNVHGGRPHLSALRDQLCDPVGVVLTGDSKDLEPMPVESALGEMFGDDAFDAKSLDNTGINAPLHRQKATDNAAAEPSTGGEKHE
jgi:hypothetical protein